MPPDETDRFPEAPSPPLGDWGAADPEPEVELELVEEPDPIPVVHPVRQLWCWRCGETAEPVAGRCPWCRTWTDDARPKPPRARPVRRRDEHEDDHDDWRPDPAAYAVPVRRPHLIPPLVVVSVAYFGLLMCLIGCALVAAVSGATEGDDLLGAQALAEAVTTGLTLVALALVWKAARQQVPEGTTAITWVASFPILALLLVANLAFFTVLRELVKPFGAAEPERIKFTLVTVLLICVQPGIVEELFFRQMTLGVLRKSMNVHLAVWLTAAVFAGAHLGNILGMPYLFMVGGFLGYARVYGGLPLAMLLHFLHNLAVVAYDAYRPLG